MPPEDGKLRKLSWVDKNLVFRTLTIWDSPLCVKHKTTSWCCGGNYVAEKVGWVQEGRGWYDSESGAWSWRESGKSGQSEQNYPFGPPPTQKISRCRFLDTPDQHITTYRTRQTDGGQAQGVGSLNNLSWYVMVEHLLWLNILNIFAPDYKCRFQESINPGSINVLRVCTANRQSFYSFILQNVSTH